jgi:hypothetical protein
MTKLVCPLCGDATSPTKEWFTGQGILLDHSTKDRTVYGHVSLQAVSGTQIGESTYGIMVCQSCERRFVAKIDSRGYWEAVYPIAHKPVAAEIPQPIGSEFGEAHLCFAVGAYRGCLAMCEVALEAVWRDQGAKGLSDLRDKGTISQKLFDQADEVRLWANVAKHELFDQPVSREDAEELLGYLEAVLDAVYVQPARLTALKQKRKELGRGS